MPRPFLGAKASASLSHGSVQGFGSEKSEETTGASWELIADVALLWASLERTLHGPAGGEGLIREVEAFVWRHNCFGVFSLFFEKGMRAFGRGDYALALEEFLAGKPLANASWEKLCVRANILFCLENLGVSHHEALGEVKDCLSHSPDNPAKRLVLTRWLRLKGGLSFVRGKSRPFSKVEDPMGRPKRATILCGSNPCLTIALMPRPVRTKSTVSERIGFFGKSLPSPVSQGHAPSG